MDNTIRLHCSSPHCGKETTLEEAYLRKYDQCKCGHCGSPFLVHPFQLVKVYAAMKNVEYKYGGDKTARSKD